MSNPSLLDELLALLLFPFAMASADESIIFDFSDVHIPGPFDSDHEFSNDGESSDDHIEPWVRYPKPGGIGKPSDDGKSKIADVKSVADGAAQAKGFLDGKPTAKAQAKAASAGKLTAAASAAKRKTPAAPHDKPEMTSGNQIPKADENSQRAQAILAHYNEFFGRNDFVFIDADGGFHCAEPADDDLDIRG